MHNPNVRVGQRNLKIVGAAQVRNVEREWTVGLTGYVPHLLCVWG